MKCQLFFWAVQVVTCNSFEWFAMVSALVDVWESHRPETGGCEESVWLLVKVNGWESQGPTNIDRAFWSKGHSECLPLVGWCVKDVEGFGEPNDILTISVFFVAINPGIELNELCSTMLRDVSTVIWSGWIIRCVMLVLRTNILRQFRRLSHDLKGCPELEGSPCTGVGQNDGTKSWTWVRLPGARQINRF